ncbi:hypothetical protein I203_103358 [Kwoniella mangroviensis CBS 8507]|uniref:uncharacterized protein n=1 Tax=Kwoniella mangroviensis CBS 8507 TaxID=1296122 RepID=UPI00080D46CF|nr:uncharacterized protein I203_06064 [Kwoniella mangroviensis CBS 8507]OCF64820.1 hypothetical protein I203_06064 [Kwoniella mangroviensis CBS 8507]
MPEPKVREIARHTFGESLENLRYNPDRINVKSEGEIITRDAMRIVHDVETLYSDWIENYKLENGLDDKDVIAHINKHRSRDKSHTEEEATKAANLRKIQGQFVHSIKDYRSTAQMVVDAIISKINDRETGLDHYKDKTQDDVSKDLIEPRRGVLSEDVRTWEHFVGLGGEERQKANIALTALTEKGTTNSLDSVVISGESIADTISQAEIVNPMANSSEDGSQDGSTAGELSWADIDEDEDKVWETQFGAQIQAGQISSI